MDRLLNKSEVCGLLGISRPTLDRIVAAGDLEALKIRGNVRFSEAALQRYLDGCRTRSARPERPAPAPEKKEPARRGRPNGSRKEPELVWFPGMRIV